MIVWFVLLASVIGSTFKFAISELVRISLIERSVATAVHLVQRAHVWFVDVTAWLPFMRFAVLFWPQQVSTCAVSLPSSCRITQDPVMLTRKLHDISLFAAGLFSDPGHSAAVVAAMEAVCLHLLALRVAPASRAAFVAMRSIPHLPVNLNSPSIVAVRFWGRTELHVADWSCLCIPGC